MAIFLDEMFDDDVMVPGIQYARGISEGSNGLDFRVMLFGFATTIAAMARHDNDAGDVAALCALIREVAETQCAAAERAAAREEG